jgi:hypothetical protein
MIFQTPKQVTSSGTEHSRRHLPLFGPLVRSSHCRPTMHGKPKHLKPNKIFTI